MRRLPHWRKRKRTLRPRVVDAARSKPRRSCSSFAPPPVAPATPLKGLGAKEWRSRCESTHPRAHRWRGIDGLPVPIAGVAEIALFAMQTSVYSGAGRIAQVLRNAVPMVPITTASNQRARRVGISPGGSSSSRGIARSFGGHAALITTPLSVDDDIGWGHRRE
jgi:hypothetical protein